MQPPPPQSSPYGAQPYPPQPGSSPYNYQPQPPVQQPPPQQPQQMPPHSANPFDPMGGQQPPPGQEPFYGAASPKPADPGNPFGVPAAAAPPPPQQSYPYQQPQQPQTTALVTSQNQSNPYALAAGAANPFGAPQGQTTSPSAGGGNPFDPFAPPPPPAPAPPPPAAPPAAAAAYPQPPPQAFDGASTTSGSNPYDSASQPSYHQQQQAPPPQQPPPAYEYQAPPSPAGPPPPQDYREERPSHLQQPPPRTEADMYDMDSPTSMQSTDTRNKYAEELAHNAPPGASPLPKAHLVRKKGFVLSRISFRTIVMKKWKQAYWVQYGPHTMLWFRSQADFDDWLNNPYHNQAQRNFLIKLAVNFVHDLYKPSVRGYQVTQCRTKAYGNKMVRQFKLERWMDYGPTIAAAFGSYNPKEVDDLREALVECMRNTPLSGGIRATGAVRRDHPGHPSESRPFSYDNTRDSDDGDDYSNRGPPAQQPDQNGSAPQGDASVGQEADLLDLDNWDDVPAPGQQQQQPPPPGASPYQQAPPGASPYQQSPYQQGPPPGASPYQPGPPPGASPYQQSSPAGYPGGYPPQPQGMQQPDFAGAIVPTQPGAPAPYPGAPPAAYPAAPSPYGASPQPGWQGQPSPQVPQQQSPYAQPPAYPHQQGY